MKAFSLTGENLSCLMATIFTRDPSFRIKVRGRGHSMNPFIKDNGVLVIKSADKHRRIKFGDIVAVSNHNKTKIFIHRVIGTKKGYYQIKGDNNLSRDGWYSKNDIIGIVEDIQGDGRIPYTCQPWQNVLIAFASKTGLLNHIYPLFIKLRNIIK